MGSAVTAVFLGSPGNAIQANAVRDMPVLMSFAARNKSVEICAHSFSELILDSGAYSELNSGVSVDIGEYLEWVERFPWAKAWSGLDDIRGDWKRSLANYKHGGFPTYHDTDPPEILTSELIPMALERGGWIGIGMLPPRTGRDNWLERTLEQIPATIHIHGWAMRAYLHHSRIDSTDSTNWWRDSFLILKQCPWLTSGEAIEIIVKRYQRESRIIPKEEPNQPELELSLEKPWIGLRRAGSDYREA